MVTMNRSPLNRNVHLSESTVLVLGQWVRSWYYREDFRKKEFQNRSDVRVIENLKVAVTPQNSPEELRLIRSYLPDAQIVGLPQHPEYLGVDNGDVVFSPTQC